MALRRKSDPAQFELFQPREPIEECPDASEPVIAPMVATPMEVAPLAAERDIPTLGTDTRSSGGDDAAVAIPAGTVHELTFAGAIELLARAEEVPDKKRRHWITSLRSIGRYLDRPLNTIPARWTSVRIRVDQLHFARLGCAKQTLANHRSNVLSALNWLAEEHDLPRRGAPLTPDWERLWRRIPKLATRGALSTLFRFCSARRIAPEAVNETVLDQLMRYRAETTALDASDKARRRIARLWNRARDQIEGWPEVTLLAPAILRHQGPSWEEFPRSLRTEIDGYLADKSRARKDAAGRRFRPAAASTVRMERARIVAAIRKAVMLGEPLDELVSFAALLTPRRAKLILEAYAGREDGRTPVYAIDLARMFYKLAHASTNVAPSDRDELKEMWSLLEEERVRGLTPKNREVVRLVRSAKFVSDLTNLPGHLMARARTTQRHAPVKAAALAQVAVAIEILLFAPVRMRNLCSILIGTNYVKPAGAGEPALITFPHYDVKNRVNLDFPLTPETTAFIDQYIHEYRPVLLRGHNGDALFPGGSDSEFKFTTTLSQQITDRILKEIGRSITPHQFRHIAGALILRAHPGNYEFVRRVLGHKNVQTTMNFYVGLETAEANVQFSRLVSSLHTKQQALP
ncbi:site-specific integrase [Alsobacter soli]|uniref:Site-specific integrase n=1 Tax=Alsobacter soli TaxID=2109933 RepID=A0A2T1HLK7_9HYPH|nr:site-specific integrase [Alsobacter soli]PSC02533.1 site-specific integrase [Alsobacter soli]